MATFKTKKPTKKVKSEQVTTFEDNVYELNIQFSLKDLELIVLKDDAKGTFYKIVLGESKMQLCTLFESKKDHDLKSYGLPDIAGFDILDVFNFLKDNIVP